MEIMLYTDFKQRLKSLNDFMISLRTNNLYHERPICPSRPSRHPINASPQPGGYHLKGPQHKRRSRKLKIP